MPSRMTRAQILEAIIVLMMRLMARRSCATILFSYLFWQLCQIGETCKWLVEQNLNALVVMSVTGEERGGFANSDSGIGGMPGLEPAIMQAKEPRT